MYWAGLSAHSLNFRSHFVNRKKNSQDDKKKKNSQDLTKMKKKISLNMKTNYIPLINNIISKTFDWEEFCANKLLTTQSMTIKLN